MTVYNWLCLLGIPSAILAIIGYLKAQMKKLITKQTAMELGLQAMLRAELVRIYNYWYPKGEAPLYVKENFENCFLQYEALGANGVMTGLHDNFMKLPIKQ